MTAPCNRVEQPIIASNSAGCHVLATDLDGTLIPLPGDQQNQVDLQTLAGQLERNGVTLIFITGRPFESANRAIEEYQLPRPDWLMCDVGTSIFQRQASGEFKPVEVYQEHQDQIVASLPIHLLRERVETLEGLRLQEREKQGRFKLSFYADAAQLDELVGRLQQQLDQTNAPYSIIHSVDPFSGDGLIDLLPATVSKAHALAWWVQAAGLKPEAIVFAGDSGNDLAALTADYRAIVVGNADRILAQRVHQAHRESGLKNRLCLARGKATTGVLEGCRWFGLVEPVNSSIERLGATPVRFNETHFRVWAPKRRNVAVEVGDGEMRQRHALTRSEDGYFSGTVPNAGPNALYQYVLDDQLTRPDPASRYQPNGVHGASEVIDPDAFPWTDQAWTGVAKRDLIIYEMHIGAFTDDGTFRAARERLAELLELGITAVEIMPVAQAPGRWNWGYDGVDLFAVRNTYGTPDDFKAFVDACHAKGLAVILDVVYNHLGPEGNYLGDFGPYFSRKHRTPWGEAFNFDGRHSKPVRQFISDNAICWLDEYHLDGLRLDAVHFMLDDSQPTILDDIRRAVSQYADATDRTVYLIAEANVYDRDLLAPDADRLAYDAIWCDCLMHSIYSHALPNLQLTPREYRGASDLAQALQYGYVYSGRQPARVSDQEQGQVDRGKDGPSHIASFVTALQTHDCVGNHPHGKRLHQLTSKAFQKSAAGLTLLYPSIPLIFMGEEFAASSPFPFFADFEDDRLRKAVDLGRSQEYPQHVWRDALSPSQAAAFYCAKCQPPNDRDTEMFAWYGELIALRKTGVVEGWLSKSRMTSGHDAKRDIFCLRFTREDGSSVLVQARLTAVGQPDVEPVRVGLNGRVLLSSEPNLEVGQDHFLLRPNHVVISET